MAKAKLTLPGGTVVTIEGSEQEVAGLIAGLSGTQEVPSKRAARSSPSSPTVGSKVRAKGPADYIRELIAGDFFGSKRSIGEVRQKLEEGAHIYPVTSLSPVLFRMVRDRELRRLKEDGQWRYVNP